MSLDQPMQAGAVGGHRRESAGDRVVALAGELGFGAQLGAAFGNGLAVIKLEAGVEQAGAEHCGGAAEQECAQLAKVVEVALLVVGVLLCRRCAGEQVEEEGVAETVGRRRLEPRAAGRIGAVDDDEVELRGADATGGDGLVGASVRQDVGGERLVSTDQALAGEVLLQLSGLRGEGLGDAGLAAVLQRGEAAEVQFAVLEVGLADALVLDGEHEAARLGDFQPAQQEGGELGQRVDAGQRDLGLGERSEPGGEEGRVGERREQQAFVLAFVLFVAQGLGAGQAGAEEVLAELALDHRLPVPPLQVGDGLGLIAFLGDVGQEHEGAARMVTQVGGEFGVPLRADREVPFVVQRSALPVVGGELVQTEEEEASRAHGRLFRS